MSVEPMIIVLAADNHIWLDSDSLISYLRFMEIQAQKTCEDARSVADFSRAVAAYTSQDVIRQIADGLVCTSMTMAEKVRSRRES